MIYLDKINDLVYSYKRVKESKLSMFSLEDFEAKSLKLLNEIKEEELSNYFRKLITNYNGSKESLSENYYYSKIADIFNNYFEFEIDEEINSFKREISREYREDNTHYKRSIDKIIKLGISNREEEIEFVVENLCTSMNSFHKSIDKLIFINNQYIEIKKSIILIELFNNIDKLEIFNPSNFQKMFVSKKLFNQAINLLIENGFVFINGYKYYWKTQIDGAIKSSKKSICTLVYILHQRNYISQIKPLPMSECISEFFENLSISHTQLTRYIEKYDDVDIRNMSDYYSAFSFIPTVS